MKADERAAKKIIQIVIFHMATNYGDQVMAEQSLMEDLDKTTCLKDVLKVLKRIGK